jgi:hypothetical protein
VRHVFGGIAILALGTPTVALAILVVLKILMDAHAHVREHRAAGEANGSAVAGAGA